MHLESAFKAPKDDFKVFKAHKKDNNFEIENYFDKGKLEKHEFYRMRITHIVDLSHFWVVIKYKEMEAFGIYINSFYSQYMNDYKLNSKDFKLGMYCVVNWENDFYRAKLAEIPLHRLDKKWGMAFLIDYGILARIDTDKIYFMLKPMYDISAFAVRAILSGVAPVDSSVWTEESKTEFIKLVSEKIVLGQITDCCLTKKVISLMVYELDKTPLICRTINDILTTSHFARHVTLQKGKKLRSKVHLSFLEPSFDVIERGLENDIEKDLLNSYFLD